LFSSLRRVVAAGDYTLILGMPGTGKTSTIVAAIKRFVARGSSVLVTAYTNRQAPLPPTCFMVLTNSGTKVAGLCHGHQRIYTERIHCAVYNVRRTQLLLLLTAYQ
jgi:hypothetical protein